MNRNIFLAAFLLLVAWSSGQAQEVMECKKVKLSEPSDLLWDSETSTYLMLAQKCELYRACV
jgi:ABC-type proline/glycine betaine transport system substrate-binding protein